MAIGAVLLTASVANASPLISIGVVEDGVNPATVSTGEGGFVSASGNSTDFSCTVSAVGSPLLPQPTLDTSSIDVASASATPHTRGIFIAEQGLTKPQGLAASLSGFTANNFTGNITSVTEYTFVDNTNSLWGGTELTSQVFTPIGLGSDSDIDPVNFSSPFSETAEDVIQTSGAGSVNDTIHLSDVPEPAFFAVLGIGVAGGFLTRRRGASFPAAA
jgi:PEP-CTERM motif